MNSPPTVVTCPSREELAAFIQGNLPMGSLETIAEHLSSCPSCESVVDQEAGSIDALQASLRHLAGSELQSETHLEAEMAAVESHGFAAPRPPPADVLISKHLREYQLLEVLGEGGMGAVYRALHTRLDKVVALKTLAAWRLHKPDAVARFRREMKAVGKLKHPNIVQATDAGEVDGTHFLVMELVEGPDLSKLVKRLGPLPVSEACELIRQAAVGLDYAHQHGLVHRDIKPSNLLLSPDGQVKLLDLGLARLGESRTPDEYSTASSVVMGSFDYMAPEQADDPHSVDSRADLYGLGCTLYYLLAGEPPFPSPKYGTAMQKLKAHGSAPTPRIQDRRRDVSDDLARLLDRLLAKQPADRCASAAELVAALETVSRGSNLTRLLDTGHSVRDAVDTAAPTANTVTRGHKVQSAGDDSGRRRRRAYYLAAGLVPALLALMILYIRTGKGTVEIVSDDREVKVIVERGGEQITLIDLVTKQQVELRSGKYHLRVDGREDLELVASDFDLMRGKKVVARIRRKAASETGAGPTMSELASRPSAADALRRKNIPGKMLALAGGGDPQKAPDNLVGIVGQRAFWCGTMASDVCFSPDGKRLACSTRHSREESVPGEVKVFSVESGEELLTLAGHKAAVRSVKFSPDGERLASCSGKTVKIWNALNGEDLRTLNDFTYRVNAMAFSRDGRRLITAGGELRVGVELTVWDAESGQKLHSLDGHKDVVMDVTFSRDGTQLASASYDRSVKVWDAETGKELHSFGGHSHWVHGVAFSSDGKRVASGCYDYNVRLWNLETGQLEHTLPHPWVAPDASFSNDGKFLVTACWDHKVRLYDAQSVKHLATFDGHCEGLNRLAFSPDSKQLALAGAGHSLHLWDVDAARWHFSQPHRSAATAVVVSPDGKEVVSGSNDETIRIWDLATANEIRTPIDEDYNHGGVSPVHSLVYDPQGRSLVSAHQNGLVKIWDPNSGVLRYKLAASNKAGAIPLALKNDGELLATADIDGLVKLWNPQTGAHVRTLRGHAAPIRGLALSLDGLTLASGSEDGVIRLWDPVTGAELRTVALVRLPVHSLAFVADDQLLAVGSNSVVKLLDVATGKERHTLSGHQGSVRMACHAGSWTVATCGADDQSVRIWDLRQDPPQPRLLSPYPIGLRVESLAFTPEGRYVITGNSDGTLYVLRLAPVAGSKDKP